MNGPFGRIPVRIDFAFEHIAVSMPENICENSTPKAMSHDRIPKSDNGFSNHFRYILTENDLHPEEGFSATCLKRKKVSHC